MGLKSNANFRATCFVIVLKIVLKLDLLLRVCENVAFDKTFLMKKHNSIVKVGCRNSVSSSL